MQIKDGSNIRRDSWTVGKTVGTVIVGWTHTIQNNRPHRTEVSSTNSVIGMKADKQGAHG